MKPETLRKGSKYGGRAHICKEKSDIVHKTGERAGVNYKAKRQKYRQ